MDKPILIVGADVGKLAIATILAEHEFSINDVIIMTPEEARKIMLPEPLKLDPEVFEITRADLPEIKTFIPDDKRPFEKFRGKANWQKR